MPSTTPPTQEAIPALVLADAKAISCAKVAAGDEPTAVDQDPILTDPAALLSLLMPPASIQNGAPGNQPAPTSVPLDDGTNAPHETELAAKVTTPSPTQGPAISMLAGPDGLEPLSPTATLTGAGDSGQIPALLTAVPAGTSASPGLALDSARAGRRRRQHGEPTGNNTTW